MLNKLRVSTAVLLACCLVWVVARDIYSYADAGTAKPDSTFNPSQEIRIAKIAVNYLVTHPDVLLEVSDALQLQQQEYAKKIAKDAAITFQAELLHDENTPSYGPNDADVAIVEFTDYQNSDSRHLAPAIMQIMSSNPSVRFIFKEWPVSGQHRNISQVAAETGLKIWQIKGAEAYLDYRNQLFATGHYDGKLTIKDINDAAGNTHSDKSRIRKIQNELEITQLLARQLEFYDTTGLVVIPATGATEDSVTVIHGMTDLANLQIAINKAKVKHP